MCRRPPPLRRLAGKDFQLSHEIVADFCLDDVGGGNVDVVLVGGNVGQLVRRDKAGGCLCLGQRHPDVTPQTARGHLRPERAHLAAAVAPGEG